MRLYSRFLHWQTWLIMPTFCLGFIMSMWCVENGWAESNNPLGKMAAPQKDQTKTMLIWYTPGITTKIKDEKHLTLSGQGRLALLAKAKGLQIQFPEGGVIVKEPQTVFYLDTLGKQARLMVLKGKASLVVHQEEYPLIPSLQAMVRPEGKTDRSPFIYDGIYRRPVLLEKTDAGQQVIIRQFYLEQLVHIDPLMKMIYTDSREGQKLVERLNHSAANLRMINGVQGYEPNQM